MKKLLPLSVLLLVVSCRWDDTVKSPILTSQSTLGIPSAVMSLATSPNPVTSGVFPITVNVTPGAMYSFQLTHINNTVLSNYGFTANSAQMTITLNYTEIANGAYDLSLIDNTGRLLKVPVIIQH